MQSAPTHGRNGRKERKPANTEEHTNVYASFNDKYLFPDWEHYNRKQGLLYGRLASLGFDSQLKAMAKNLTHDVVYSSEIGEIELNADEERSSNARKRGFQNRNYSSIVLLSFPDRPQQYLPLQKFQKKV